MDNLFTMPINFAIKDTMKKFENSTDEDGRIIYESLRRCDIIWDMITLSGVEIYGLTYEQFCKQFEEKRNVVFFTDEELEVYRKISEEFGKFKKLVRFIDELKLGEK